MNFQEVCNVYFNPLGNDKAIVDGFPRVRNLDVSADTLIFHFNARIGHVGELFGDRPPDRK